MDIFGILNSVILIILLITWLVAVYHIIKISKKLHEKDTHETLIYELKIAETSGNKQRASELYVKLLFAEWEKHYEFANFENKIDELKEKLKMKYQFDIERNGGTWSESFHINKPNNTRKLNNAKAYYENGVYTKEEYEAEKEEILKSK